MFYFRLKLFYLFQLIINSLIIYLLVEITLDDLKERLIFDGCIYKVVRCGKSERVSG